VTSAGRGIEGETGLSMNAKPYDIVVFGATSFVGQILCKHLAQLLGFNGAVRWAAAGRSPAKLWALRETLGVGQALLPAEIADAGDEKALAALCAKTRVVISTVGPYALYGEPLVRACVDAGVDYCDLTGEPHWIARMIALYEEKAKASGARIVHCCGFDSIPSDMGVYFLEREARRRFGRPCSEVKMRVKAIRGGVSGGTVASMLNAVKEVAGNSELRRALANPYALCPPGGAARVRQDGNSKPGFDSDFDAWFAPFAMAPVNTKVVHRSNALSQYAYGAGFRYGEAMLTGQGLSGRAKAYGVAAALGAFVAASAIPPARWALQRILPAPGEGPPPEARKRGFFDLRFLGKTEDGATIRAKVAGDADPGYGSTGKMLGAAALCLAALDKAEKPGGFWTPATAFGDMLIDALEDSAGVTFEVL
jgi:short subunit dehydrogenase-like uncharacterized protein